ncbi:sensor histidine kinase [Jiangella gansuensis]|uniref:sensor histidine kinase n=1 Tax=Jiangella gansuensis TaxID=281473 RepID=UPI0004B258B9|nr:histidine kinase [Jiangella gansuensis]
MTRQPRFAWLVAFGVVALLFVSRVIYHLQALDYHAKWTAGLAAFSVAAVVALAISLVLLIVRRGNPALLLGIQAVAVFAPYLVIGQGWALAGTVLCASILLVVPRRTSWVLFAAVAIGDAGLAASLHPSALMFVYVVFVNVANGFAIFAIVRMAQLVQQTHDDGQRLADIEVEAERLRAADRLSADVGSHLSALTRQTREVLRSPTLGDDRLTVIRGLADRAATDARTIADIHRNLSVHSSSPTRQPPAGVGLRFATWAHLLIVANFVATSVINLFMGGGVPDHLMVGLVVVLVAAALQLAIGTPRAGGAAVRWWPIALAVQVSLLVGATVLVFPGGAISIFLVLAGGTVLVRIPAPWSWAVLAVSVVAYCAYFQRYEGAWGGSYMAIGVPYWAVIIYALHNLPVITHRLHATRDELTRVAVITERLRLARDIHDLLGFHLSAIKLKVELAVRTKETDPAKARDHLAEAQRSAERALTEVRTFANALENVTCRDELIAAQAILEAGGAAVAVRADVGCLPQSVDNVIGIVVREAATNIIRHSTPGTCTFDISGAGGEVAVRITNDGVERPRPPVDRSPPAGLDNLQDRVEALGGRLTAVTDHDTFTLTAQLPVEPPAALPIAPVGGAECTSSDAAVTVRAAG